MLYLQIRLLWKSSGWDSQLKWYNFNNILFGAPNIPCLITLLHQQNKFHTFPADLNVFWKGVHLVDVVPLADCQCKILPPDPFKTNFDSITYDEPSFNKQFKHECFDFLNKFDDKTAPKCDLTIKLLDSHFTETELDNALKYLKDKKCSGIDGVPSECFKYTW